MVARPASRPPNGRIHTLLAGGAIAVSVTVAWTLDVWHSTTPHAGAIDVERYQLDVQRNWDEHQELRDDVREIRADVKELLKRKE